MNEGIRIFAIGLGRVSREVLERIGDETGGRYYYAPTSADLEGIYLAILNKFYGGYILSYKTSVTGCNDHILEVSVSSNGATASDSETSSICVDTSPDGGGGSCDCFDQFRGGGG